MPYYNHNDHYTGLLLRHAPKPCSAALDVGCGEGRLVAKLAEDANLVVGIDPDSASIDTAGRVRHSSVELIQGDFLQHDFGDREFDFITAVASIHHMPFAETLQKMAHLLRPGGVIGIIGLYRSVTVSDRLIELAAVPVNAGLAWSRASPLMAAPAIDATMALTAIRSTSAEALPGSVTGRLLLWRYLLTWRKPASA